MTSASKKGDSVHLRSERAQMYAVAFTPARHPAGRHCSPSHSRCPPRLADTMLAILALLSVHPTTRINLLVLVRSRIGSYNGQASPERQEWEKRQERHARSATHTVRCRNRNHFRSRSDAADRFPLRTEAN